MNVKHLLPENQFFSAGSRVELTPEQSELIEWVEFNSGTMDVCFRKNGRVYRYYGISPAVQVVILDTKVREKAGDISIGAALHHHVIKHPELYPYERIK